MGSKNERKLGEIMYKNTTIRMYKYTTTVVFQGIRLMNRHRSVNKLLKKRKHLERKINIEFVSCLRTREL